MADLPEINWFRTYLERLDKDLSRLSAKVDTLPCFGLVEKLDGLERYVDEKFNAQALAVEMARNTMDKRLDGMNEFREALRDQASKMMTRSEYAVNHEKFRDELSSLTKAKERMEGKASQTSFYVTAGIAIFSLLLGAIHVFKDVVK